MGLVRVPLINIVTGGIIMTNNNLVKIDIASQFMRENGIHHWVFQ